MANDSGVTDVKRDSHHVGVDKGEDLLIVASSDLRFFDPGVDIGMWTDLDLDSNF